MRRILVFAENLYLGKPDDTFEAKNKVIGRPGQMLPLLSMHEGFLAMQFLEFLPYLLSILEKGSEISML